MLPIFQIASELMFHWGSFTRIDHCILLTVTLTTFSFPNSSYKLLPFLFLFMHSCYICIVYVIYPYIHVYTHMHTHIWHTHTYIYMFKAGLHIRKKYLIFSLSPFTCPSVVSPSLPSPNKFHSANMSYPPMRENMQRLPFWIGFTLLNKLIPSTTVPLPAHSHEGI